ncbi:MAG: hypothetical protein ABIH25_02145 [Candidatus Woesearchaeota archaeon]
MVYKKYIKKDGKKFENRRVKNVYLDDSELAFSLPTNKTNILEYLRVFCSGGINGS